MSEHRPASSSGDHAILVIEDDQDIASLLKLHLGDSGYDVSHAATGPTGLEEATGAAWNLIILDLMLPGLDGMEICRRIRAHNPEVPILMLTARGEEIDKILGFEVGADDYMAMMVKAITESVRHLSEATDKAAVAFAAHKFLINLGEFDELHL